LVVARWLRDVCVAINVINIGILFIKVVIQDEKRNGEWEDDACDAYCYPTKDRDEFEKLFFIHDWLLFGCSILC